MSKVTFQVEPWETYYAEARLLWPGHWKELATDPKMPCGPDVEFYKAAQRAGIMQIVTARTEGRLVGYQISIIRRHTHYPVLCAFEDTFYLDPLYRKGMTGVKLISQSLKFLKALGVQRVYFMSIDSKPTEKLFQFLKFKRSHTVWSRRLD